MRNILVFIICLTLFFCLCVGSDITPYLRGPAPYPPDWRWDYLFVNTYPKIWVPLLVSFLSLYVYKKIDFKKASWFAKNEKFVILIIIFLCVLFQFAVLFFNRAGMGVLVHRIINPDLNGYFSSSLDIEQVGNFFKNFNGLVLKLDQHAQGHPPFSILFFWIINKFFLSMPFLYEIIEKINPARGDVFETWNKLLPNEKLGALFSTILIPFLSALNIFPLYKISKKLYGQKVALRTAFLYLFIPGVVLFIPINDVFISLFPLFSFWLFITAIDKSSRILFIFAGLLFSVGLFFSLSLLPMLLIFIVYGVSSMLRGAKKAAGSLLFFVLGLLVIPIALGFVGFNSIQVFMTIMSGLPENRHYYPWVLYNLYDFFIFLGIGVSVIYMYMLCRTFVNLKKNFKDIDPIFLGTFIMILMLDLSGSVRGEVGRIWIPFMPFFLLPVANFITSKKYLNFSRNEFIFLSLAQVLLVLVINEYWVTLW